MKVISKHARILAGTLHIAGSCLRQSVRHPRTAITHCSIPLRDAQSPTPWWAAGAIMLVGVGALTCAGIFHLEELSRAGQSLTELPLVYMVGRGHQIYSDRGKKG